MEIIVATSELDEREQRIERMMRHAWYEAALEYRAIRDKRLYRPNGTGKRGWQRWEDYCPERWNRTSAHIDQQVARALEMHQILEISSVSVEQLPSSMSHATELAKLPSPQTRAEVWQRILARAEHVTAKDVQAEVERKLAELNKNWITLAEWQQLSADDQHRALTQVYGETNGFNETNDNIEWAAYSWNPVTGCQHSCIYCYARDIAHRFYPQRFEPSIIPSRLGMPSRTKSGEPRFDGDIGYRSVFVCSMADLFGAWVPQEWIDAVLESARRAEQWTFIFLTKNPARLAVIDWPRNAWVGTTVDTQARVAAATSAMQDVNASVRFLSCEPLRERLTFSSLDMFEWVIIGGQSKSSQAPEMQPEWEWVRHLENQGDASGCAVYYKPNLTVRRREYPRPRQ